MKGKRILWLSLAAVVVALLLAYLFRPTPHVTTPEEAERQRLSDSAALKVALVANEDCLPLYYAFRAGLIDTTTLPLRLLTFYSNMDCERAVRARRVELAYMDVARALLMEERDTLDLTPLAMTPTRFSLVANKKKRITEAKKIKAGIIGMERHSASDCLLDHLLDSLRLGPEDIYRAQIGEQRLRQTMVSNGQIEAGVLTEPFAAIAKRQGHKPLWAASLPAAFVLLPEAPGDSTRKTEARELMEIYDRAVDEILHHPRRDILESCLRDIYGISDDDLPAALTVKPQHLDTVGGETEKRLGAFLVRRKQISSPRPHK